MHDAPLVTVCMTTYNHELYIEESILSVINQDYPNLQIIISDDCSTDKTYEILKRYQQLYPQIIEIQRHSPNVGVAKNVSSLYPPIKGQYICWLSGDDVYLPQKISKQVTLMSNNRDCILSFHAIDVINNTGEFLYGFNDLSLGISQSGSRDVSKKLLEDRCFICAHAIMINRELAQNIMHREEVGMCSDWLLLFELAVAGKVLYMPDNLALYRRHPNNLSRTVNIVNEENVYNYVLKHYPTYRVSVNKGLAQLYTMYVFKYLFNKKFIMALYCIKKLFIIFVRYPLVIPLTAIKFCSEFNKRIKLLRITGTIVR